MTRYRYLFLYLALAAGCASPSSSPPILFRQDSGTDALFIGLSAVDDSVVWLAGTGGTFALTTNGGETWTVGVVPGADSLQFRDVHGVDAQTAYLLSIGNGEQSRIYKTVDGGASWMLQFVNPERAGFLDCMDFWDPDHGLAFSDSIDQQFYLIETRDGGASWQRIPTDIFPPALAGEGSFAASGTCLITLGDSTAMIGTGAGGQARILRTDDRGRSWHIDETPVMHGTSTSGLASVSFLDERRGAAAGGDVAAPDTRQDNIAVTIDGGVTWRLTTSPTFHGAIYGVAFVPGAPDPTLVAVGPGGLDVSFDQGRSWTALDTLNYWTVGFAENGIGWAAGMGGNVVKLIFE